MPEATKQRVTEAYRKLPLSFIPNRGQTDTRVRYYAQGQGFGFYFTDRKAVLALSKDGRENALELRFVGANPSAELEARRPGDGRVNYLNGSERTTVSTYGEVAYRNLWPGIDMVFRGSGGALKYEFLLHPGADPSDIGLAYAGASGLSLTEGGALLVKTPNGRLRDAAPRSYQRIGGRRVAVKSRFALAGKRGYGFALGRYDRARPLVIDPAIGYSTYLGGSDFDYATGIAVDSAGNAYVTGEADSADFPTTTGVHDTTLGGTQDAFVTKLNATGTALVYSTYLGGSGFDEGRGIALDAAGSAYVTGRTRSADFPTTTGAFDTTLGGVQNAFVTKLNPTGSTLLYSTYLGGSGGDDANGIAVDAAGSAYVTGDTSSADFPTTTGASDTTLGGGGDAFVTKLNPTGSALLYSTYLGGSGFDEGRGIALDAAGSAYVTGRTLSADFPTTTGAFDTTLGGVQNAFVTKLNATGTTLLYSTYLGGSGADGGFGIAVDAAGSAYVTGDTSSADFPTTTGAPDTTLVFSDGFVTKLNATGSTLLYSTYLGGSGSDRGNGIALDAAGSAYVTGETSSGDFPLTTDATDPTYGGNSDAFVTKLNATGTALDFSTYLGGSAFDGGFGIAVDAAGSAYVTGETDSGDFPTTTGAFDTTLGGCCDAFVTKFSGFPVPPPPTQCDDGDDDDGDDKVDEEDPGCVEPDDDSEDTDSNPECSDELDNDSDEEIDGNDSECESSSDDTEEPEIQTLPFTAVADARVEEDRSSSNFGTSSYLRADNDPEVEDYLRFNLTGIAGQVLSAKLRLYVNEGTGNGPAAYKTNWTGSESSLTWSNRTARTSGATDDKGSLSTGSFVEFNVTALVAGNGLHSFILDTSSSDSVDFSSRETSTTSRRPQLLVTFGIDTADPNPPSSLTAKAVSATQVLLGWSAGSDNYGVTGYRIYRDNSLLATVGPQTSYSDTSAVGGTTYSYEVSALDGAGNESAKSNTATVTTPLAFTATADARVEEAYRYYNFGTSTTLRTDGGSDPDVETFLRFQLAGLSGPPTSAKLRLYVTSGTANGPAAYSTASTWAESGTGGIRWSTRTARTSAATDDKGAISSGGFVEFNVTSLVAGDGAHSFILATTSTDGVDFSSRETSTSSRRPQLLVIP